MKLNAPETWSVPSQSVEVEDAKLGRVRVTLWSDYHFRQSPKRVMAIIRVEVPELCRYRLQAALTLLVLQHLDPDNRHDSLGGLTKW